MTYLEMKIAFERAVGNKQLDIICNPTINEEQTRIKCQNILVSMAKMQKERFQPKINRKNTTFEEDLFIEYLEQIINEAN